MHRFAVFLALALMKCSQSFAASDIECPPSATGDMCIHLEPGKLIFREDESPQIQIDSRVIDLRRLSHRILRNTKPYPELAGFKTEDVYAGKGVHLNVTKITKRNTCFYKNEAGKYGSVDKGCGTDVAITIVLGSGSTAKIYQSRKWYGS